MVTPNKKAATVMARRGQQRFRFQVMAQYGSKCAVCDIRYPALLKAAHICGVAQQGSDDWRNGIPLCATHHDAFDDHLFCYPSNVENARVQTRNHCCRNRVTRNELKDTQERTSRRSFEMEVGYHLQAVERDDSGVGVSGVVTQGASRRGSAIPLAFYGKSFFKVLRPKSNFKLRERLYQISRRFSRLGHFLYKFSFSCRTPTRAAIRKVCHRHREEQQPSRKSGH